MPAVSGHWYPDMMSMPTASTEQKVIRVGLYNCMQLLLMTADEARSAWMTAIAAAQGRLAQPK